MPDIKISPTWKLLLEEEFAKPYYKSLTEFTSQESSKFSVYPPEEQIFSAFNLCPFDKIKVRNLMIRVDEYIAWNFRILKRHLLRALQVVIIGQDPYHGQGQAHGLCFSVQKGVQIPPSLRNMIQELKVKLWMKENSSIEVNAVTLFCGNLLQFLN